jgi:hypothetical protein
MLWKGILIGVALSVVGWILVGTIPEVRAFLGDPNRCVIKELRQ